MKPILFFNVKKDDNSDNEIVTITKTELEKIITDTYTQGVLDGQKHQGIVYRNIPAPEPYCPPYEITKTTCDDVIYDATNDYKDLNKNNITNVNCYTALQDDLLKAKEEYEESFYKKTL